MRNRQVVVIGSHDTHENLDASYEIGKHIALNNWVLLTGGRGGIMESASRGAFEAGGMVIGILPGIDLELSNPYCNIVIPTGIGFARNLCNILSGDIIIAIGGSSGTLSELSYCWQYGKPVIACMFGGGITEKYTEIFPVDGLSPEMYKANSLNDVFNYLEKLLL